MRRLVIALALIAAGCGSGSQVVPHHPPGAVARSPEAITARLVLPSRTIAAGSSMSGHLIVENDTGRAIRAWGCGALFVVALASRTYRPSIAWPACIQSFTIPAGRSRYRVTVEASYYQCSQGAPQGAIKACGPDGRMPPLPPGDYQAILFQLHHLVQTPPPVPVRVTPP
jgi:hypothetical protein